MYFLGIDLAWNTRPSSASPVVGLGGDGTLCFSSLPKTDADILELAGGYEGCLIGIDAPLVVNNTTGSRECDRRMIREYGIPLYQVNRTWLERKYGGIRGEILSSKLARLGYPLTPDVEKRSETRAVLEVYPHASLRALLGEVPRYKRGSAREGLTGLMEICDGLAQLDPPLDLSPMASTINPDLLDAAVAAHTAYLHWGFKDRTVVVGDPRKGFIVFPRPLY